MSRVGANSRGHGGLMRYQRGAVAIIVGLSLAVMIGFAGLALDLGRLYVNRTELQSAADACALAAARELICDTSKAGGCPGQFLRNAEVAGIFAAGRNQRDLQAANVVIAPTDVKFSTVLNANYLSYNNGAGGADVRSKFAMCTARSTGIVPWFMGVVGLGAPNAVAASAVATLAPSQNFCVGPPMGVCSKNGGGAPDFGYAIGEWITSAFTAVGNSDDVVLNGGFKWVDFDPAAGGNSEIRDGLVGADGQCNVKVDDTVNAIQAGAQQGAKSAYNTRFGIYPQANNSPYDRPAGAPPDRSGYAYPSKSPAAPVIAWGQSAYADYRNRQAAGTPFNSDEYDDTDSTGKKNANNLNVNNKYVASSTEHLTMGGNRRLVAVPALNCDTGKIIGSVCVLMLNPMGDGSGEIYLEYVGNASSSSSPCAAFGTPGGPGGKGALVPTLVQ